MSIDEVEMGMELNAIKIDSKSEIDMQMEQLRLNTQIEKEIRIHQMEINKEIEIQREKSKQMEMEIEIQREKSKQMEMEKQIKIRQMEMEKEIRIHQMKMEKEIEMQRKDGNTRSSQPTVYSGEEVSFTTIAGSLEKITDTSACAIANNNRDYYDPFTVPCRNEAYIPNARLRRLKNKLKSAEVLPCNAHSIPLTMMEMQRTWNYPSGGSETIVNHPNLKVFLSTILSSYNKDCDINSSIVINNDFIGINSRFIFASERSKPEHVLMYGNCVLLGSEAKGANASNIEAG
jgi:hypothetical protein